jgi:hypothetical protein
MKMSIYIKSEINVKKLYVKAYPRYIQDASVNGDDELENNPKMPFMKFDERVKEYCWEVNIDIDKGQIIDWPQGTTASIHYKVCDEGSYELYDENDKLITSIDDYVPSIMCPKEPGYGDYIIMDIDKNGFIQDWDADDSLIELLDMCGIKQPGDY